METKVRNLAPLTERTSKKEQMDVKKQTPTCIWTNEKMLSRDVLLVYPDFSKPFVVHTDASDYQPGTVISQNGKPIVFYLQKLNDAQTRYVTTEK